MIETMKKFAACALTACALSLVAAGVAWGGVASGIELESSGDGIVAVNLKLPEGADDVRALKLTLAVESADADALGSEFAFDDALAGVEVRQVRSSLDEGTRRISVYAAAKDRNLFEGEYLNLGSLTLTSEDGVAAKVSVAGFEAVNAAHDAMGPEEAGLGALGAQPLDVLVPAAGGTTPNPPQQPEEEGDGPGSEGGDHEGGGSNDGSNGGSNGGLNGGSNDANVSPGAPSGTDASLVATGDSLLPVIAGSAALALVAGIAALAIARLGRRSR